MNRAALAVPLALVVAASAAAQEPVATGTSGTFRTGTQLVPLNITVTDAANQFVRGLSADEFLVLEDGVPQQVEFFETSAVPTDLIILLDTSSSMSDKMDIVHEAAAGFLETLRPGDRGAIVSFADAVNVLQGLTEDRAALEAAIRSTRARGATSLYNALYISLKQFGFSAARRDGEIRRQAIAVLSDGEDTSSLLTYDDVLGTARRSGVTIYPIALQSRPGVKRRPEARTNESLTAAYAMRQLAQETGAQAFFPSDVVELEGIYGAIAQELSHQYALAYAPANARADGTFRRISVRLNSRPELKLRTRMGYIAEVRRAASSSSAALSQ